MSEVTYKERYGVVIPYTCGRSHPIEVLNPIIIGLDGACLYREYVRIKGVAKERKCEYTLIADDAFTPITINERVEL
jgi:hypothetical protein